MECQDTALCLDATHVIKARGRCREAVKYCAEQFTIEEFFKLLEAVLVLFRHSKGQNERMLHVGQDWRVD